MISYTTYFLKNTFINICLRDFLVAIIYKKIREYDLPLSHPVLNRMLLSICIYILLDFLSQLLVCRKAVLNFKGGRTIQKECP